MRLHPQGAVPQVEDIHDGLQLQQLVGCVPALSTLQLCLRCPANMQLVVTCHLTPVYLCEQLDMTITSSQTDIDSSSSSSSTAFCTPNAMTS